jgi:hypothetical protein
MTFDEAWDRVGEYRPSRPLAEGDLARIRRLAAEANAIDAWFEEAVNAGENGNGSHTPMSTPGHGSPKTPDHPLRADTTSRTRAPRGPTLRKGPGGMPVHLNKYDGTAFPSPFLVQFQACAEFMEWNEQERVEQFHAHLQGSAALAVEDRPAVRLTYAEMVRMMRQKFGPPEDQRWAHRLRMSRRRRGVGESLYALYRDIKRTAARAFPEVSEGLRGMYAVSAFTTAVYDTELVADIMEGRPRDLDEAYLLALDAEATREARAVQNEREGSLTPPLE